MGDDEIAGAAKAIRERAKTQSVIHEPRIVAAIEGVGGTVARLGTQVKTLDSLLRKLGERASERRSLFVNDSLRYTAVLDFDQYWTQAGALVRDLRRNGYSIGNPTGWFKKGYQGMNLTVVDDSTGFEFELQFHTLESLRASDETHAWYAERRLPDTTLERKQQLNRLSRARYALVPRPPDVPVIS